MTEDMHRLRHACLRAAPAAGRPARPGAVATASLAAQQPSSAVTYQDLLRGLKDPTRWLTFSGDYSGQRHSPLTQITPENVKQLDRAVDLPDRHAGQVRDDARSSSTACCM